MRPLPEAARPVNCCITEKSDVKSPAAISGTAPEDPGADELLLDDELQAANPNPSKRTAVPAATFLSVVLIDASSPP